MRRFPVPFLAAIGFAALTYWKSGMGPAAGVAAAIVFVTVLVVLVFPRHPKPRPAPRTGKDWPVTSKPMIDPSFVPGEPDPFGSAIQTGGGQDRVALPKENQ